LRNVLMSEKSVPQQYEEASLEKSDGADSATAASVHESVLDQFKLSPGDMIQLQTLGVGQPERYQTKVIGILPPVSVMVATPKIHGKVLFVRESQQFLVRCFIGRDAVAYRSRVLKSNLSPFAYLHLEYPESVQSMRIRTSARAAVDIVASIETSQGKLSARMVDLSGGGARVLCGNAGIGQDELIRLAFRVNPSGIDVLLKLQARVKAIHASDNDTAYGLQFENLSAQDKLYLTNMVYQNLLKDNL